MKPGDKSVSNNPRSDPTSPDDNRRARTSQASEVAQVLAQAVSSRGFPQSAAEDLSRLLGHSLADPGAGNRRNARLGLLIDLLSDGSGEVIVRDRYERERKRRRDTGQQWPSSSQLCDAYGHWLVAVRAAARFWFDGGHGRVWSSHKHARQQKKGSLPRGGYLPREMMLAIIRFRDTVGDGKQWPSEWEYETWAAIQRQLARRAGVPTRVPGRQQIRRAYGSFDAAREAAKRWDGEANLV